MGDDGGGDADDEGGGGDCGFKKNGFLIDLKDKDEEKDPEAGTLQELVDDVAGVCVKSDAPEAI